MKKESNKKAKKGIKTIIYRLYKLCKDNQLKIVSSVATLILALIGIVFSIGGNDYDWSRILSNEEEYSLGNVKNDSNIDSALYYLIIDTSEPKPSYSVTLTNSIMEQIETINMSGYCPYYRGFDFDIDNRSKTIKNYRLLQVQLMYTLIKLYERKKENLSVVLFSDHPQILSSKDLRETFKLIYNQKFQGWKSNYDRLFTLLRYNIEPNKYDKTKTCHIILFSENYHDFRNQIGRIEHNMQELNIVIKSHYFNCGESSSIFSLKKIIDSRLNDTIFADKPLKFCYNDNYNIYI